MQSIIGCCLVVRSQLIHPAILLPNKTSRRSNCQRDGYGLLLPDDGVDSIFRSPGAESSLLTFVELLIRLSHGELVGGEHFAGYHLLQQCVGGEEHIVGNGLSNVLFRPLHDGIACETRQLGGEGPRLGKTCTGSWREEEGGGGGDRGRVKPT